MSDSSEHIIPAFFINLFIFTTFLTYLYYISDNYENQRLIQRFDYIIDNTKAITYYAYKFIYKLNYPEDIEEEEQEEEEELEQDPIKYEDKYLTEYHELEDIELSKDRLDSLKNSILMENTPQGNLIMFYDNSRESFTFYADNTIPYRYLETVGRKYVIMNNCKHIFVDMAKEIDDAKKKLDETKQQQQEQKQKQQDEESSSTKKNVFAKLKNYNNNPTNPRNSTNPAPQSTKKSDLLIVKEHANRYSYEGKMANFSFLKKVDRKVVDKKYAMSFAEFRAMQNAAT